MGVSMQHRFESVEEPTAPAAHCSRLVIEDLDGGWARGGVVAGICWAAAAEAAGSTALGQLAA